MKICRMLFLCVLSTAIFGCASVKAPSSYYSDLGKAGDPFAASLAAVPQGTSAVMQTPYGPDSQVRAGYDYMSGLGIPCRRMDVMHNGLGHRLAICSGRQGWFVSEPVFDTAY